jgi:hypothetical protein
VSNDRIIRSIDDVVGAGRRVRESIDAADALLAEARRVGASGPWIR